MVMKWTLILLIGLGANNAFGQVQNEVKKVLATKDFIAFKTYTDNLSMKDKNVTSNWDNFRDLTTDFQEGTFIFSKYADDKNSSEIGFLRTFRVRLLATDKIIAYYELSEMKYKKVGDDEWDPYYEFIEKYKDEKAFSKLSASFKEAYQADLNEKELFVTDFVYGEACGFSGTDPVGRRQVDKWVLEKNKPELLRWLKSTNTEKQVYAVDGLLQLRKRGMKLADNEMSVMKCIIKKRGTINACSGCTYYNGDIKIVAKNFNL